jgi:glycosyltransferase involved in cell wall biosynthesis
MKITHIILSLQSGGAEHMLIDIMHEQLKLGHKLKLIVVNHQIDQKIKTFIDKKIKVVAIKRPEGSRNLYYFIKLYLLLYINKSTIIHCHNISLGSILKFYYRNKIVTVHDIGKYSPQLKYFNKVIAISIAVKSDLLNKGNCESDVIHNGIKTSLINLGRKEKQDDIKLVQISRLKHDKKGQDILINAIFKLVQETKHKNIKCYFIGEGPSEVYLKEYVKKLALEKNIIFLGLKDRFYVYENLYKYDILVQPSRYEGFGLTIVEAMAAKVPVLVSDIEGPMEVIRSGEIGEYFNNEDINNLSEKLIHMIQFRNNKKVNLAYEFTRSNYDIKNTAYKYIEEYKGII